MQRTHELLDLSPLLQQSQTTYGTRDLYTEKLQNSSSRIQSVLNGLDDFRRNKRIKKSTLYSGATLTLMALYAGFVYLNIRFFSLKQPSLIKYLDTPINNNTATCGDLYPMRGNVCKYESVKHIPKQTPFVFYCLDRLSQLFYSSRSSSVTDFVNRNCYEYFANIDFGDVAIFDPLLQCISYVSQYGGGTKLDFLQYLNATVIQQGVTVLCTSLLSFANNTEYGAFRQSNYNECALDVWEIGYREGRGYTEYRAPFKHLGPCNTTYPAPTFPEDDKQYVYNVAPGSGTCYDVAKAECQAHYWNILFADGSAWITPLRGGLIGVGIVMLIALLTMTCTLIYLISKSIRRSYIFQDLEQNQQQEINNIVSKLGANAGVSLQDKGLEEVKREITKLQATESKDLKIAKAFLDPEPGTPLSLFFQQDGSYEATDMILSKVITSKKP